MDLTILKNIIDELKNSIPKKELDLPIEFLKYDEWGLAFEFICDLLLAYQIPISSERFNKIAKLGKLMEMDDNYWLPLEELVNETRNNR